MGFITDIESLEWESVRPDVARDVLGKPLPRSEGIKMVLTKYCLGVALKLTVMPMVTCSILLKVQGSWESVAKNSVLSRGWWCRAWQGRGRAFLSQ